MSGPNVAKRPRWGQSGRADPVAEYVAPRLGMRPGSVEQLMKSVNHRCAAVIDGFTVCEDWVRLTRFMEPIDAALARIRRPTLSLELATLESETDQGEQVAQDLLAAAPSREHALVYIRRSQAARAAALRYELAIAARWGIPL